MVNIISGVHFSPIKKVFDCHNKIERKMRNENIFGDKIVKTAFSN